MTAVLEWMVCCLRQLQVPAGPPSPRCHRLASARVP